MCCKATEIVLGKSLAALVIENDVLACTIILDKGADIYRLIYKPKNIDVMWKAPWGLKESARGFNSSVDSQTAWLEAYAGGWQLLFPNGGFANTYKGANLSYHGEASMKAWNHEIVTATSAEIEVKLSVRLSRSPYSIERWIRLEAGSPVMNLRERIRNHAGEAMDCMWSHHPAFGAPFISEHCIIDTDARRLLTDDAYIGAANPLELGRTHQWPLAGDIDLSRLPPPDLAARSIGLLDGLLQRLVWYHQHRHRGRHRLQLGC